MKTRTYPYSWRWGVLITPLYPEPEGHSHKTPESRTVTVNAPTRTFTWPLTQPKPSLWRRLLRWFR